MYDLLIRGGRIIDGSGMPSFHGDVAVKDGRIVEVGGVSGSAQRTIEADGLVIAPGFIDNHCHFDAQVTWDPLCTYSCYHGVTTVISGNCSLSLSPAREEHQDLLLQMLSRVEAIPIEALRSGVRWSWGTFGEYLEGVERGGLGVNYGLMVGHSAIRRYIMGEEADERSEATPQELEAMKALIRESVESGALGVSFNRNRSHRDLRGKLIPGVIAPVEELVELASSLRGIGTGVIQCGAAHALEIDESLCTRFHQVSGRPVIYNQIIHRWSAPDHWAMHLQVVEDRIRQGNRVYPLINPRSTNNRFTLKNAQVFDQLPSWLPIMMGSTEAKLQAFGDPDVRKKLYYEAVEGMELPYNAFSRRWDMMYVSRPALEKNAGLRGKNIAEIAQERGTNVLDAFLDLAIEENLETGFEFNQTGGDPEAMSALLSSPYTVIGLSDGGAHVVFDAGYGYSTHFLGHWVRERNVMPLEDAVRKLTFMQASLWGLHDRGLLWPGMAADIVLFDPDTVAPDEPIEVVDLPGGNARLQQFAKGIKCTLVNGEVLIEDNQPTGALPGRIMRSRAPALV